MKETTYLDRVELFYVDHPGHQELLLDENIMTQGAYDELKIQTFSRERIAPVRDVVVQGRDQTNEVVAADGSYVYPYVEYLSQWGGWTEKHAMELTTSAPASVLLLEGRIAWYDSSVAYAIHQNGREFTPMKLERVHDDGRVALLVEDVGIPTGMDRTMVVPLGDRDRELPAGARLRLTAQHRFLWDRIRTSSKPSLVARQVHRASLRKAELYHHGYSEYIGNPVTHAQGYDFDRARPDDRYPRARGLANEYGDVRSLVTQHDDRLVILVAGDAVMLEFDAEDEKPGMSRTWFFRITGWAKEGSFHNETGQYIDPLPFRKMSEYPPPVGERSEWVDRAEILTRRIR